MLTSTLIGSLIGLSVGTILYYFFYPKKFTCPKCAYKQFNSKIINVSKQKELIHGRITNEGGIDKRFNSFIKTYKVVTYSIKCEKCNHEYEFVKNNKKIFRETIINNDPVIKKIDKEVDDLIGSYRDRLLWIKHNKPEDWKEMVDAGLVPKDYE